LVAGPGSDEPDPKAAARAVRELRDRGVIVGRGGRYGNVLKLSPPLIIERRDLETGLDIMVEVLST
ncbi:MAG TPA: hypothetical protein VM823_06550, partial [Gaiellales bacterium]|nr:hypothetical protein [Gaiellales bacterium]